MRNSRRVSTGLPSASNGSRRTWTAGVALGTKIVAALIINQGLVRFLGANEDSDRATDDVISRIQAKGVAWFGGATWRNRRVISVCNWQTTDDDIDRTLQTIAEALADHGAEKGTCLGSEMNETQLR